MQLVQHYTPEWQSAESRTLKIRLKAVPTTTTRPSF